MKSILGFALVWNAIQLSRPQCVLEKEYFCSSIPNGFPEGLTSILFVVTNLGVVNSTVFNSPSLASVTSLTLANSGITEIEDGALYAFQSLTKLSLYQNSVTHVSASWLSNPGRLENLTVAQNFITQIGPNMFSGLSNLITLNLANNRIRDIAGGSFKDLAKLKFIDLSGNRLTSLRRTVFHGLTMLPAMKLGDNPWNCSCELQDWGLFLQEMINATLLEDAPNVVCHAPLSLQGVHVWNISDFKCSPARLPSAFGNAFHKVGLPTLLACLVFISFLVLLIWIWRVKRDNKQVRPSKDVVDPAIGAKSMNCVDSVAECQQSNKTLKTSEIGTGSRNMRLKVRAKSASAILLQTEFYQRRQQTCCVTDPKWDPLTTTPYVSLNDKMCLGRDNFMEVRNCQTLEKGNREEFQSHYNVGSFLTEVCIETPGIEAETANPTLQGKGFSGKFEDNENKNDTDNPEPFLYLSIATAPKEQVDVNPPKDLIPKPDGNHSAVLKRTLTWPYERKFWDQKSNMLNIRGSFRALFLIPSPHSGEMPLSDEIEGDEAWLPVHSWKEHDNGKHQVKGEEPLAKEAQLPNERQPVEVFGEIIRTGTYDSTHPRKGGQRDCGGSELEPTNQTEFLILKESEVAVRGFAHSSKSRVNTTKCPTNIKNIQFPKPMSSQTRARHVVQPSPGSSVDAATISSSYDDAASLENNENNYMNLLHEVVENRGRWTRERWKQNRRMCSVHQSVCKSK